MLIQGAAASQAIAAAQAQQDVAGLLAAFPGTPAPSVRLAGSCLVQEQRLVLQLVSHKKMLLWDAVLSLAQAGPLASNDTQA